MNNSKNRHNADKKIYIVIAVIAIICLMLSMIIYFEKDSYEKKQPTFCSAITGNNGCETVQTSSYGRILGVSNPIYGIIGFTLLAILALMNTIKDNIIAKGSIIFGSTIAGIVASWFLYVQTFILHTYCIFCVIVDILSLTLFAISIYILISIIRNNTHKYRHK
jgi:uncharacterized membrane protein